MAKIRAIDEINVRYVDGNGNTQVAIIPKGSFIEVTEENAVHFCNEDIVGVNERVKKAVRTGFFSVDNLTKPHQDYTFL